MSPYSLKIHLLSDTTFGRGDGIAGLIDQEVEHDSYGFPYLRGRTLKGLLREECDNLVALLTNQHHNHWLDISKQLFGRSGSCLEDISLIHVGDACLPQDLRKAVALQFAQEKEGEVSNRLTRQDILSSLTSFRRQTAVNPISGVATDRSLRSSRVILRNLCFKSNLKFEKATDQIDHLLLLLAAGTVALRRVGSDRNRGRGHVQCSLWFNNQDITQNYLMRFHQETSQ